MECLSIYTIYIYIVPLAHVPHRLLLAALDRPAGQGEPRIRIYLFLNLSICLCNLYLSISNNAPPAHVASASYSQHSTDQLAKVNLQ